MTKRTNTLDVWAETITQPDGAVLTLCTYCELWVLTDMAAHVAEVCPVARYRAKHTQPIPCPECGIGDADYGLHESDCSSGDGWGPGW